MLDVFKRNYEDESIRGTEKWDLLSRMDLDTDDIDAGSQIDVSKASPRLDGELNIKERLAIIKELTNKADYKDVIQLDQNIVNYSVLLLFKHNRRKFELNQEKQVSVIQSAFVLFLIQAGLAYCVAMYCKTSD